MMDISPSVKMLPGRHPYFDNSGNTVHCSARRCDARSMKLDDAAARLEPLGSPTRLKIYRTLAPAGHPRLAVGRLHDKLQIAPSPLSHLITAQMVAGLI